MWKYRFPLHWILQTFFNAGQAKKKKKIHLEKIYKEA